MSICHYAMRILCMIWNTADPQTTKMKRPNNQGPTAYFSSAGFSDFGTLPLVVIFLLCFSLANLILCLAAISVRMRLPTFKNLYNCRLFANSCNCHHFLPLVSLFSFCVCFFFNHLLVNLLFYLSLVE